MPPTADKEVESTTPVPLIPAAQYIRMSTEHQQYSTENQADVIREYARQHGFQIVRTYADEGKSGLSIGGRAQLQRLLEDVEGGSDDFRVVLVYDVSRWGRFQDSDESAHYEFLCKRNGIRVIYCAEQFDNDGSPTATIIKNVKRAMAGEYSRELSAKVHKGQCKLIELGFRQGGTPGLGLRRMLLDGAGNPKGLLRPGEHKSLQTDRVILVPGPDDELRVVRRIFRLFTEQHKRESEIAADLQGEGVPTATGRPWTRGLVHEILTNEKYIGNNVYNRISAKLKTKPVQNPPALWVRKEGAFEPVVDPEVFWKAAGILQERNRRFTQEQIIESMRQLLAKHGQLTAGLIDEADGMPSSAAVRNRFGSLIDAYRSVGFVPQHNYEFIQVNRRLRALYPNLISQTMLQLEQIGASVTRDEKTDQLLINGAYTAAIVLTRCRQTHVGSLRWLIQLEQDFPPDLTVMVRMDPANECPVDYYLLPMIDVGRGPQGCRIDRLRLQEDNGIYYDAYRFESLSYFMEMAARVKIEVAA
jgi:DNA invertase Pin-like site-specific DNA recombinase